MKTVCFNQIISLAFLWKDFAMRYPIVKVTLVHSIYYTLSQHCVPTFAYIMVRKWHKNLKSAQRNSTGSYILQYLTVINKIIDYTVGNQ